MERADRSAARTCSSAIRCCCSIIPGLVYFWRSGKHAEFYVVLEAILAFVLFNASFGESIVSWGGGTATGPRQVTPAMPFFALALIFLPPTYNFLMAGLAGLSTLYMLAAISTNPHFPYEYPNPVWQFALPHYFRGDFSFNRDTYFGGGNVFGDSVAFNLGKLMGLPRSSAVGSAVARMDHRRQRTPRGVARLAQRIASEPRRAGGLAGDRDPVRSSADRAAAAASFTHVRRMACSRATTSAILPARRRRIWFESTRISISTMWPSLARRHFPLRS